MKNVRRSKQTHERILQVAEDHFARFGFDAAGVAQICLEAGVSKGAFYHHFPSKQTVFLELLERWMSDLDGRLAEVRRKNTPVLEALTSMAGQIPQIMQEGRQKVPIFLEFLTKAARQPDIWRAVGSHYGRYSRYFAEMLENGMTEGTWMEIDSQKAATILVSMATGVLLQGILDPEGTDWEGIISDGVRLLLKGLEPVRSADPNP
jgi:AcrR family transcriptional regulator